MYNQSKASQALSNAITAIEAKNGERISLTRISKAIGISRRRFTELLKFDDTQPYQEPSFTVISKIIEYFKLEGYALSYDDFISDNFKTNYETNVIELNVYDLNGNLTDKKIRFAPSERASNFKFKAFLINNEIAPLYPAGTIFIVDKDSTDNNCSILYSENGKAIILRRQLINNISIYANVIGGNVIAINHVNMLGKIIYITLNV